MPRIYPVAKGYSQVVLNGQKDYLHRVRAERALGRPLPAGVHVHHADGTTSSASQLVICQDNAYHKLLHARLRVLRAGGDPSTQRICSICHTVKPLDAFLNRHTTKRAWLCRACVHLKNLVGSEQRRQRKAARRALAAQQAQAEQQPAGR